MHKHCLKATTTGLFAAVLDIGAGSALKEHVRQHTSFCMKTCARVCTGLFAAVLDMGAGYALKEHVRQHTCFCMKTCARVCTGECARFVLRERKVCVESAQGHAAFGCNKRCAGKLARLVVASGDAVLACRSYSKAVA